MNSMEKVEAGGNRCLVLGTNIIVFVYLFILEKSPESVVTVYS